MVDHRQPFAFSTLPDGTIITSFTGSSGDLVLDFSAPISGVTSNWPTFIMPTSTGPNPPDSLNITGASQLTLTHTDGVANGAWSLSGAPPGVIFDPALIIPQSGTVTDAP